MEQTVYSYSAAWRWLTQPAYTAKFIAACKRYGITKAILQADATVMAKFTEEPDNIATAIASMKGAGIDVYAAWNCQGTPGWDTLQDKYTLHQMIDFVFQHNVMYPDARFAGLEFDWEPASDSSMDQHANHLEACITTIQTLRAYSLAFAGTVQSVGSQGLPIWMFCDPRWGRDQCADPWGRLCELLDVIELECYRYGGSWDGTDYPEGIDISVAYNGAALNLILLANKKFITIISVVESSKYSDEVDRYATRYGLGVDGCTKAIEALRDHYETLYPNNYLGGGYYYDIDSFLHFSLIQSITAPTGNVVAGSRISIPYVTWRDEESYQHKIMGIMAELVDADGAVTYESDLIDPEEKQTTERTIEVTIPFDAAPGPAAVRLSAWAVEYITPYAADTDPYWPMLYYRDFSGYIDQLLALSIDELYAMKPEDAPKGTLNGRRPEPIMLQYSEWQTGLTIEKAEENILKVINILVRVKSKVQVTSGDETVEVDPGGSATFNVTLKSNAAEDTPVSFSLAPAISGIKLATSSGVAHANAETSIPVQLAVGDLAEGDYALQCTISA